MKLLLFALSLSAADYQLTPEDRANLKANEEQILRYQAEVRAALLARDKFVLELCAKADATAKNCNFDMQTGVVARRPDPPPKVEPKK